MCAPQVDDLPRCIVCFALASLFYSTFRLQDREHTARRRRGLQVTPFSGTVGRSSMLCCSGERELQQLPEALFVHLQHHVHIRRPTGQVKPVHHRLATGELPT